MGIKRIFTLVSLGLLLLACDPPEVEVAVSSVSVSPSSVELAVGESTRLSATVSPSDAKDKTVTWSTSSASVATVSPSGEVTAVAVGSANITASAGGKSAVCKVTVVTPTVSVSSVTLDKDRLDLTVGGTAKLTATVSPADASDKNVTWESSDAAVATVDKDGNVKALKGGTSTVTAKAGGKSASALVDVMEVTPSSIEIDAAGGDIKVTVVTTRKYHLDSKPDWITEVSVDKQVHTFKVAANTDTSERSGVIVICDEAGTCLSCQVKQAGAAPVFSITPDKVDLEAKGGTFTVTVTANHPYHLSSTPDWVKEKSFKDNVYTFEVGANEEISERSGVVVICDDAGTCLPCTVKQAGAAPVFSISPQKVDLEAAGGTFTVTVTANHPYHLSSTPDWVTEKSFKDNVYTFEVGANEEISERNGVVVICDDAGVCLPCSVKQAGAAPVFSISPQKVDLEAAGGTFTVTVTANHPYHLSSTPDWVTEKSFKDNVYTFEVGANEEISERSGVVVICDDTGTCLPCSVKQAGAAPAFSISPQRVEMAAEGGTFDVTVTANTPYHISSTPDWVTLKTQKDNVYTFEVGFNEGSSERSGVIVICDEVGTCLSCTVRQEGIKPFDVSPKQVNVRYDGGTFDITVTSSYGYHINSKPDWVTEKSVNGKVHTFEVGPSSLSEARSGAITFCDDVGTCLSVTVRQEGDPEVIDWDKEFVHRSLIMGFVSCNSWGYREFMRAVEAAGKSVSTVPSLINFHLWDNMEVSDIEILQNKYDVMSPLRLIIDARKHVFENNYNREAVVSNIRGIVTETESNYPVSCAIGFDSSLQGQKLDMNIRLYAKQAGNYKISVFVLEDGVIKGQYDEEEEYIENYPHNNVARMAVTDIDGDSVSASARSVNRLHYSVTVPASYNKDKLKLVVFVQRTYGSYPKLFDSGFDCGDYYVVNSASGAVGAVVPPALVSGAGGGNEDVTNGEPVNW